MSSGDDRLNGRWRGGVRSLWKVLRSLSRPLVDAAPPYRRIEGRVTAKEADRHGGFFLLVDDSEIVEVDWLTYEILMEGEAVRVRCTRSNKAISIDRLLH